MCIVPFSNSYLILGMTTMTCCVCVDVSCRDECGEKIQLKSSILKINLRLSIHHLPSGALSPQVDWNDDNCNTPHHFWLKTRTSHDELNSKHCETASSEPSGNLHYSTTFQLFEYYVNFESCFQEFLTLVLDHIFQTINSFNSILLCASHFEHIYVWTQSNWNAKWIINSLWFLLSPTRLLHHQHCYCISPKA